MGLMVYLVVWCYAQCNPVTNTPEPEQVDFQNLVQYNF